MKNEVRLGDCIGKTLSSYYCRGEVAMLTFTDDSFCVLEIVKNFDNGCGAYTEISHSTLKNLFKRSVWDYRDAIVNILKIMTDIEYKNLTDSISSAEEDRDKAERFKQYLRLKKEFEND